MKTGEQYPITLVTAYFDLGREQTKHAGNPYPHWIRNFLPVVRWPLAIFCDEQSVDMLRQARGDRPAVYHVTRLQDFLVYRYLDAIQRCASGTGLSAEYGLIQCEKHSFLRQALSENPFGSEMFFWCDIGLFRPSDLMGLEWRLVEGAEWPNLRVCRALPQDKVILWNQKHDGAVSGSFFGGSVDPARRWCDAFHQCLEQEACAGTIFHLEEHIMQVVCSREPALGHAILPDEVPWLRFVNFLIAPAGKKILGHKWYFLNGRRFPWKYLYKRIFSYLKS